MNDFLASLYSETDPLLEKLRGYASAHNVPILRPDSAAFLRTLVLLKRPGKILEAGTAIGYSALLMAKAAPDALIETVELDADTAAVARGNIRSCGPEFERRVRVILGDASEVFASIRGSYDMIFLDSAKGQYVHMLDDVLRLLSPGGLLVADNCIFYGKVFDEPASAPHKHRTIVANMRAFVERVLCGGEFDGSLLECGDGMLVAVKR